MISSEKFNLNSKRIIVGQIETIISQYFRRTHDDVYSLDETNNYRKAAYEIVEEMLSDGENKTVTGDADDFHNLAVTFSKEEDYETALEIVKLGLRIHKANTDLLADAIKYGCVCGSYDECDNWCSSLNKITKRKWTWRAYSFLIDYFIDKLDRMNEISDEQFENDKTKILELVKEYQDKFYDIEDSWYSEFEVHWKLNERKKARDVLEELSQKKMSCPKIWLRYADILMDDGNLDQAEILLKRLKKEDYDSSYAYYLDGRCRLGKFLRDGFASTSVNEEEIHETYRIFALAWRLNTNPSIKDRIRSSVRRLYFESEICPLPQYCIEDYGISFNDFD